MLKPSFSALTILFLVANAAFAQLAVPRPKTTGKVANLVQNAVLEGVQISSEPGEDPNEKMVTCYFIFRDRPTSYFYEADTKKNELVFEFNDTQMGASPIPSMTEPPIKGFEIAQERIDVNARVRGLLPEWHDVLYVKFDLTAVPKITVKDEFSVVSFTFNWSTSQANADDYVLDESKGRRRGVVIATSLGAVIAAGGAAAVYVLRDDDTPDIGSGYLDNTDLPSHPSAR